MGPLSVHVCVDQLVVTCDVVFLVSVTITNHQSCMNSLGIKTKLLQPPGQSLIG